MLEKNRKPAARKKSTKPAARGMDTDAAPLPTAKQTAPIPPAPSGERGRVTQAAPAVAAGAAAAGTSAAPGKSAPKTPITAEARWRMIAEAAYFKAQRRGFAGGDAKSDWAEAEAEIDAWLLESR
jgi:hypothetical protein